ncbi:MAG: hypothetical protein CSA97_05920 [Bacteroidetes bacterium]|nr:MAG: hypothetical protein CSA97_05920 [Bacteroidota bacterium]
MEELFANPWFTYLGMPVLIFLSRIVDVSIGTVRIVFVARGDKLVAPILGFFEVFIWILAIGQIMEHANNLACYGGYAAGFAMGNYIGLRLEEYVAVGHQVVRVITRDHGKEVVQALSAGGFGATIVDGEGAKGKVQLIYCVVNRKKLPQVLEIIHGVDPKIFYSIEDVRKANSGVFPAVPAKRRRLHRRRVAK